MSNEHVNPFLREALDHIFGKPREIADGITAYGAAAEFQPIECCSCGKVAALDENGVTQDKTWVIVARGNLAAQDAAGLDSAGELADKENLKFSRHICGDCFLTDPDLCRFFNRCGLRIR